MTRRIYFILTFLCLGLYAFSQSDTLVTKKGERIPCKITEIGEDEIKYKKADNLEGPVYSIHKNKLREMIFSNGSREYIKQDEMAVDQKSTPELLNETRVFKLEPFSPFMNYVCVGYEQMIKVGTNLEVKAGYINSLMNINNRTTTAYNSTQTTGGFIKGGVKFLLGQDFVMRGLKYAHPLKGRYIRLDADLVYMNIANAKSYFYYSGGGGAQTSDVNVYGYGFFINYGRQFVLGDILTLDYYVGFGASGKSVSYTNPSFNTSPPGYPNNVSYYENSISNYYVHVRTPSAFSVTYGLSLGYIIKGKTATLAPKNKPVAAPGQ